MPPWTALDTIMFDMDGTLLDLHFDNYFWRELLPRVYSRRHGVSEAEARASIEAKSSAVRSTLDWYCLEYWRDELEFDVPGLKGAVSHKIAARPNAERLLRILRASGKRLLLVTNAHPASLALKMSRTGLGRYFDRRISSHSLRLAKENPGFWSALREVAPYDPARAALFDDSPPVLRQARREGIGHLWAIRRPDSRRPPLEPEGFPQVDDFDRIMPPPARAA